MSIPTVGSLAPDFTLPDQDGKPHSLREYQGTWVLLYFYPKDDTPGCTIEACTLRDQFKDFQSIGATVLGVSKDSVASHKKFVDAYTLPFTLLADEEKNVVQTYGVLAERMVMGKSSEGVTRTSFLIDPEGKIRKVYEHVKPETHAAEVITDLKALAG